LENYSKKGERPEIIQKISKNRCVKDTLKKGNQPNLNAKIIKSDSEEYCEGKMKRT